MESNAKLEAIKKAWGELWVFAQEFVYPFSDGGGTAYVNELKNTGWVTINFFPNHIRKELDFTVFEDLDGMVRPISLRGLETNNQWIRIESEEDLPSKNGCESFKIGKLQDDKFEIFSYTVQNNWLTTHYKSKNVTHYKPIQPELLPIY